MKMCNSQRFSQNLGASGAFFRLNIEAVASLPEFRRSIAGPHTPQIREKEPLGWQRSQNLLRVVVKLNPRRLSSLGEGWNRSIPTCFRGNIARFSEESSGIRPNLWRSDKLTGFGQLN
jgi:hypothetical protein